MAKDHFSKFLVHFEDSTFSIAFASAFFSYITSLILLLFYVCNIKKKPKKINGDSYYEYNSENVLYLSIPFALAAIVCSIIASVRYKKLGHCTTVLVLLSLSVFIPLGLFLLDIIFICVDFPVCPSSSLYDPDLNMCVEKSMNTEMD